jgi:hypothetical protein
MDRRSNEKGTDMKKKTNRKSASVKSLRNLPEKKVTAKSARGVKGGASLSYGKIEWKYTQQKPDGT